MIKLVARLLNTYLFSIHIGLSGCQIFNPTLFSIHIGQAGCQIGFEAWQLFGLEHGMLLSSIIKINETCEIRALIIGLGTGYLVKIW